MTVKPTFNVGLSVSLSSFPANNTAILNKTPQACPLSNQAHQHSGPEQKTGAIHPKNHINYKRLNWLRTL